MSELSEPQQQKDRIGAPTGLETLDCVGGLAAGRSHLAYGPVGSGKTSFALSFLASGVARRERVALVTRTNPEVVLDHFRLLGSDLEPALASGAFALLEYAPEAIENAARSKDADVARELRALLEDGCAIAWR